ncbi:DEAD/DEAH box helicase [Frateuria hangzhouensis]|uniref:DEAD/DEAH box helicase n=1 Tax=Frateuria hangzhouensis TaxID=2995589 RepID=UPI002260E5F5|nr:DEAD/DEAH box helicase [Frateuria sp. STR12]MCX7514763.1 hypothetical protein [Frateuria sp. STR12]
MSKIIDVFAGNPGTGKTQFFIENLDPSKRYVYVSPTRKLALEVMERLEKEGKPFMPIFASQIQEVGSVIKTTNEQLVKKQSPLLIITHKCLASIDPSHLKGWELVVDEALKVEAIDSFQMLGKEFEIAIAPFVGDCAEDGSLLLNEAMQADAWEIHFQGIEDAKNRKIRSKPLLMVLDAILSPTKSVTATPRTDAKGKPMVTVCIEGYTDFTKPFTHAESVTLMGANVDQGLAVQHLERSGFFVRREKKPSLRTSCPIILPLIKDAPGAYVSKAMLLTMPDGTVAKEWNSECFGQKCLDRALEFIGKDKAIFASHEWCKPVLPENVERTPFDTRGMNEWRDKHISIHMLHGNPAPHELAPINRMLDKMGIPLEEGKQALRWQREDDQLLQFASRTKLRDEDCKEPTYHIVTSYTQAQKLVNALDGIRCLSEELLEYPPLKKRTDARAEREAKNESLAAQVLALKAKGYTQRDIARELGTNQSKIKRLLKPV